MNFITWLKKENSLNFGFPELITQINRGSESPASAEVKRTGLQPQVGSEAISTPNKEESERLDALEKNIDNIEKIIAGDENSEKINKFKNTWEKFRKKWEKTKKAEAIPLGMSQVASNGLGSNIGDEKVVNYMQQNPNVTVNDIGPSTSF
jgi:hypothetical protein